MKKTILLIYAVLLSTCIFSQTVVTKITGNLQFSGSIETYLQYPDGTQQSSINGSFNDNDYYTKIQFDSILSVLRAELLAASRDTAEIVLTTTGASFSPIIEVASGGTILWTFSDATTSTSSSPAKNFGSSGTRVQTLTVTPSNSLLELNLGYGAEDSGSDSITTLAQQNVSIVTGLSTARNLKGFYASGCPLTSMDFSNCSELLDIEMFNCTGVTSVDLSGATKIRRVCFENNALTGTLNLSENLLLEDLRAAANQLDSITWGSGTFPNIWHICLRDNFTMDRNLPRLTKFPNVDQLWVWNSGQTGVLDCRGINPTSLLAADNLYTSANFEGCTLGNINISGNNINSINVTSLGSISGFNASTNNLNESAIDGILNTFRSYSGGGYTLDLTGNTPPSATGLTYVTELEADNWVVLVDESLGINWLLENGYWSDAGVWDDNGTDRVHNQIHPDNLMDYDENFNIIAWNDTDGDHIGEVGALRLGKAMWWMLARMAGWDGN